MLSKAEIVELEAQQKKSPAERPAQKKLAQEVTTIVHGADQAKKQQRIVQAVFGGGSLAELDEADIATVREELPSKKAHPGSSVMEVLVETGLASSNSEARRLLQNKAIYVNNQPFDKSHLDSSEFKNGRLMLRRGKAHKDSALVELA